MAQAVLTPVDLKIFAFGKGVEMALGLPQGPGPEEMLKATEDLRKALGSALIAGGMAVIHYGYRRLTDDIDILYAYADGHILERLKTDFRLVKKLKSGWHKLEHRKTGVRLELIPEGALGTYGFIPGPKTVGGDGAYISLLGVMWLKLVSGRSKDDADIVEVAKARPNEVETLRDRLPQELRGKFAELLAQAKKEKENDPSRPPDGLAENAEAEGVGEAPARYAKKTRPARPKRSVAGRLAGQNRK